jgi:hypothetical protein
VACLSERLSVCISGARNNAGMGASPGPILALRLDSDPTIDTLRPEPACVRQLPLDVGQPFEHEGFVSKLYAMDGYPIARDA